MTPGYREDVPYEIVGDRSTTPGERRSYWLTGSALQATDGLATSRYAHGRAEEYIAGRMTSDELVNDIRGHYRSSGEERSPDAEADIVAARTAGVLEKTAFALRPAQLAAIHRALFDGVLPEEWVGKLRSVNLSKPEPVLGGRSVEYADFSMVAATLDYDFGIEASRAYTPPLDEEQISRFAGFISNVWQAHPFREGNTRTVAVFSQLYLRHLGNDVTNDPFIENSVLYRDALVRASFSSIELGVEEDRSFIERFYENVALGAHHVLNPDDLNVHGIRIDADLGYRDEPNLEEDAVEAAGAAGASVIDSPTAEIVRGGARSRRDAR